MAPDILIRIARTATIGAALPVLMLGVTVPARPGDVATLAGCLANPVTVTLGNVAATVVGTAIAPGNPGLYQIAFEVPATVPDGDLALVAQVPGLQSPVSTLFPVKRQSLWGPSALLLLDGPRFFDFRRELTCLVAPFMVRRAQGGTNDAQAFVGRAGCGVFRCRRR